MTTVLRGIGILILCLAGIAARMQATQCFDPPPSLPSSLRSPVLAMELVRSADDIRAVLRDPIGQKNRQVMKSQIDLDWYFIAAYGLCFWGLGIVLRACGWPGAKTLGALCILSAGGAALCDIFENLGILEVLDTEVCCVNNAMARTIRHSSLAKWALLAVVEATLVPLFLAYGRRERLLRFLATAASSFFAVAALLGFAGLQWNQMIEWSTIAFSLGLLSALPVCLFLPGRFLAGVGAPAAWSRGVGRILLILLLVGLLLLAALAAVLVFRTPKRNTRANSAGISATAPEVNEEQVASRLLEAVRIKTVSRPNPTDQDHQQFQKLHAQLKSLFPGTSKRLIWEPIGDQPQGAHGDNLLVNWKGSDSSLKPLLLLAHMDTVPAEDEANNSPRGAQADSAAATWPERAFGARSSATDPELYGRGMLDDKVSVVCILEAIETLLKENFQPRRSIYLAFGSDEEVGGKHGALKLKDVLVERKITPECILDEGSYVMQNIDSRINFPVAAVGIAEKGYFDIELSVTAEGGHSAMPPQRTALGILSRAITKVEDNPMPVRISGVTRQTISALAPELPFGLRFVLANDRVFEWLLEYEFARSATGNALIRTTAAVTIMQGGRKDNVLPDSAFAIINCRSLPGDSSRHILDHVVRVVADPLVKVDFAKKYSEVFEASEVSPIETDSYRTIAKTIRQSFGGAVVVPFLLVAGTDARHYQALTPNIYRFLPIRLSLQDLKRIHGVDERISRQDLVEAVKFYYQLIKNFSE